MKGTLIIAMALVPFTVIQLPADAEAFSSGSNGSYGPINVISGIVTLDMPANGIFNCTTISVASGATLQFNRNPLNTPVYLLATGDITIAGTIDVSGKPGTNVSGGEAGPGGFDGGEPGLAGGDAGAGLGPGGGLVGAVGSGSSGNCTYGGRGAYFSRPDIGLQTSDGNTYGSAILVPLVGGSGGAGTNGRGGSGAGGAILLSSDTQVVISGSLISRGGTNFPTGCDLVGSAPYIRNQYGLGSGGAIRIVSPSVSGTGTLDVRGGCSGFRTYCGSTDPETTGAGRIRIDLPRRSQLAFTYQPSSAPVSAGAFMAVFPTVVPRLDVVAAAGQTIAEGTPGPVMVILPSNSPTAQTVTVQARDFTAIVPIRVVLTPDSGAPLTYDTQIDMSTGNPAQVAVTVQFPVNVRTRVNAWTR